MIYIASPYSHGSSAVMDLRADVAAHFAMDRFSRGHHIYSPIASWHHIAMEYRMESDFTAWRALNFAILRHAKELWVLKITGWETSVGVAAEIALAKTLGIPVRYFNEDSYLEVGQHDD
jgi:hypothetical protein